MNEFDQKIIDEIRAERWSAGLPQADLDFIAELRGNRQAVETSPVAAPPVAAPPKPAPIPKLCEPHPPTRTMTLRERYLSSRSNR